MSYVPTFLVNSDILIDRPFVFALPQCTGGSTSMFLAALNNYCLIRLYLEEKGEKIVTENKWKKKMGKQKKWGNKGKRWWK